MLSIKRCRELVKNGAILSNEQIKALRDTLYGCALIVVDAHQNQPATSHIKQPTRPEADRYKEALNLVPNDEHYEVEERAAIVEYEAGTSRKEAEQLAMKAFVSSTKNPKGPTH